MSRALPVIPLVTTQVVDVDDAELFPEIAAARAWVAEQRKRIGIESSVVMIAEPPQ